MSWVCRRGGPSRLSNVDRSYFSGRTFGTEPERYQYFITQKILGFPLNGPRDGEVRDVTKTFVT